MHRQSQHARVKRLKHPSQHSLSHPYVSTPCFTPASSPKPSHQSRLTSTSSPSKHISTKPRKTQSTPSHPPTTTTAPHSTQSSSLITSILPFSRPLTKATYDLSNKTLRASTRHFSTTPPTQILPNPLHTSSQIHTLFPDNYAENIGINPGDKKLLNPPQRLSTEPGLWGLRGISTPSDFDTLYVDKVHQIEARAHRLLTNPTTAGSLQHIDDMSKLLCDIADLSEAIRINHRSGQWTRKANSVHQSVQDLLSTWSSSPIVLLTLYNIIRTKEIWDSLPLEGRRVVLDLIGRMNMNTIIAGEDYELIPPQIYQSQEAFSYLEEKDLNWVAIPSAIAETLSNEDKVTLSRYTTSFKFRPTRPSFLTTPPPPPTALSSETSTSDAPSAGLSGLRSFLSKNLGKPKNTNTLQYSSDSMSLPIAFRNSPAMIQSLLQSTENHKLRRLLYKYRDLSHQSRLDQLQDLIKYRHLFALCQGHLSYAHSINASHLSKTPNVPIKAITTLLDNLTHQRLKEYKIMSCVLNKLHFHYENMVTDEMHKKYGKTAVATDMLKTALSLPTSTSSPAVSELLVGDGTTDVAVTKTASQDVSTDAANPTTATKQPSPHTALHMSDIPYVIQSIRAVTNASVQNELPNYLQLDSILQGIGLICNVMDVQLEAHMIREGEGWGNTTGLLHSQSSTTASAMFSAKRVMAAYGVLEKPTDMTGIPKTALNPVFVTNATYHHAVHQLKQPQTWCMISDIDLPTNHHLVAGNAFKLHFVDKSSQELLGVLYVDPYDSQQKQGGGAQYVICCGRMAHEFADQPPTTPYVNHPSSVDSAEHVNNGGIGINGQSDQSQKNQIKLFPTTQNQFETPTTFLTTSIDIKPPTITPNGGHFTKSIVKLPTFTYDHIRLLFHEVGHAFHTIKSRTQFQHYSGSRCEMDFVETPSTLFEILAQDPKFIKLFAKHHITGAPLPDHLFDAIAIQQTLFPTHKITQTGLMSLLDLRLFGVPSPITSPDDVVNPFKVTTKLAGAIQRAHNEEVAAGFNALDPQGQSTTDERSAQLTQVTNNSTKLNNHKHFTAANIDDMMLEILENEPTTDEIDGTKDASTSRREPKAKKSLNCEEYRPDAVLNALYKERGFDETKEGVDPNTDTTQIMGDILNTHSSPHASPAQTILQAHAIYRRYGNIDIHENGPGVMFGDEDVIRLLKKSRDNNNNNNNNNSPTRITPEILRQHYTMHALTTDTPSFIYPHAEHTHLSHYGGFYFSYLYCRAFATVVKKRVFDPLFDESQRHSNNSNYGDGNSSSLSFTSIAELNKHCGGAEHRKSYLENLQNQHQSRIDSNGVNKSMFDYILPTTRNGVDFRQKVLQPGGSQSGLDILADLLISPEERMHIAKELKAQKQERKNKPTQCEGRLDNHHPNNGKDYHAKTDIDNADGDLSAELELLTTQQYSWPDEIFATPFAKHTTPNNSPSGAQTGNTSKLSSVSTTPSDIAYTKIGVLSDEFLGQEQLEHREAEKKQWAAYLATVAPELRAKLPQFPPHSSDLSLIYSTLTNFQHHVGWKMNTQLPYGDEDEVEGTGDESGFSGIAHSNAQCRNDDGNGDRSEGMSDQAGQDGLKYDYFDPMMVGLTPLQQRVLQLSFETLEKETIEQSELGLKHILRTIDV